MSTENTTTLFLELGLSHHFESLKGKNFLKMTECNMGERSMGELTQILVRSMLELNMASLQLSMAVQAQPTRVIADKLTQFLQHVRYESDQKKASLTDHVDMAHQFVIKLENAAVQLIQLQAQLYIGLKATSEALKEDIEDIYLNFEITTAFIDADEAIIAPTDALIRILLTPLVQQEKTVLKRNTDFLRLLPSMLNADPEVLQKSFPFFDFEPLAQSQTSFKKASQKNSVCLQTEEDHKLVLAAYRDFQNQKKKHQEEMLKRQQPQIPILERASSSTLIQDTSSQSLPGLQRQKSSNLESLDNAVSLQGNFLAPKDQAAKKREDKLATKRIHSQIAHQKVFKCKKASATQIFGIKIQTTYQVYVGGAIQTRGPSNQSGAVSQPSNLSKRLSSSSSSNPISKSIANTIASRAIVHNQENDKVKVNMGRQNSIVLDI